MGETLHDFAFDGIAAEPKHDRHGGLGAQGGISRRSALGYEDLRIYLDDFDCQLVKTFGGARGESCFDDEIAAFDVAKLAHAVAKRFEERRIRWGVVRKPANAQNLRLLR